LLRRDARSGQRPWQLGEAFDLDAAQILEGAFVVGVASNTIGDALDLARHVTELRQKLLPLRRNSGTRLAGIAAPDSGDENGVAILESNRRHFPGRRVIQSDRLDPWPMIEPSAVSN